jgi:hypothetical protein
VQRTPILMWTLGRLIYLDFYVHGTVKNAIEARRDIYTEYESDNLRKYY